MDATTTLQQLKDRLKTFCEARDWDQFHGPKLADTFFFLIRFSQKYGFDLSDAFHGKMELNDKRYPVELIRGKNSKYTELKTDAHQN